MFACSHYSPSLKTRLTLPHRQQGRPGGVFSDKYCGDQAALYHAVKRDPVYIAQSGNMCRAAVRWSGAVCIRYGSAAILASTVWHNPVRY